MTGEGSHEAAAPPGTWHSRGAGARHARRSARAGERHLTGFERAQLFKRGEGAAGLFRVRRRCPVPDCVINHVTNHRCAQSFSRCLRPELAAHHVVEQILPAVEVAGDVPGGAFISVQAARFAGDMALFRIQYLPIDGEGRLLVKHRERRAAPADQGDCDKCCGDLLAAR